MGEQVLFLGGGVMTSSHFIIIKSSQMTLGLCILFVRGDLGTPGTPGTPGTQGHPRVPGTTGFFQEAKKRQVLKYP